MGDRGIGAPTTVCSAINRASQATVARIGRQDSHKVLFGGRRL